MVKFQIDSQTVYKKYLKLVNLLQFYYISKMIISIKKFQFVRSFISSKIFFKVNGAK